jgi:threonine aldolase
VKPFAVSLTQPTEAGFCYALSDIANISAVAHEAGCAVHMDGARLPNALESPTLVKADGTKPSLSELTWKLGVDVLCFGTTKGDSKQR